MINKRPKWPSHIKLPDQASASTLQQVKRKVLGVEVFRLQNHHRNDMGVFKSPKDHLFRHLDSCKLGGNTTRSWQQSETSETFRNIQKLKMLVRIVVAIFHARHIRDNDRFRDVLPDDLHRNSRVSKPFSAVFFYHHLQEFCLRFQCKFMHQGPNRRSMSTNSDSQDTSATFLQSTSMSGSFFEASWIKLYSTGRRLQLQRM